MEGVLSLKRRLFWSDRSIKVFCVVIFLIALPIYLLIGFQPASSSDYSSYPTLSIPSINLETPVIPVSLEGRQLVAPSTIAGIYSSADNKQLIIGHSSTVFKTLDQVPENDTTFSYDDQIYRITDKSIVEKSKINMSEILKDEAVPTIIIMTCAGTPLANQDATHRLIITAELATD